MKRTKKLLCLALAVAMVLSLFAIGSTKAAADTIHHKIGVALYTDAG